MQLESPAFEHNQQIPSRYTCDGEDLSPKLIISDAPKNVKSYALIVDDPDAPRGTFVHWVAWNISSNTSQLDEGAPAPREGINGFGSLGYRGPCPPPGKVHHYHFKLYALDTTLNLEEGSSKEALLKAIKGHIISETELVGTYKH